MAIVICDLADIAVLTARQLHSVLTLFGSTPGAQLGGTSVLSGAIASLEVPKDDFRPFVL